MHDCYVTATLINSWLYYLKSREEYEQQAKEGFFNCLNKVKTEPTEAMQRGIDFENAVHSCDVLNTICEDDDTVNEITDYIKGGLWQETVTKHMDIDGLNVLIYGKADVIKMDTIYDIKRVSTYDIGKYTHSSQHLFYLYCTGLPVFKYLVSDGNNVFVETYTAGEGTPKLVKSVITEFFNWLKRAELFDTYLENWKGADK